MTGMRVGCGKDPFRPVVHTRVAQQTFREMMQTSFSSETKQWESVIDTQRYTNQDFSVSFWCNDGLVGVSVIRCEDFEDEKRSRESQGWFLLEELTRTFHPQKDAHVP